MEDEESSFFIKKRQGSPLLRFLLITLVVVLALGSVALSVLSFHISTQANDKSKVDYCKLNPISCNDYSNLPAITSFSRVVVAVAHPDDAEGGAGGTIAWLVEQGVEVYYIVMTNGDKGTRNRSITPEELTTIRKQEQLNAAAVLGVKQVIFLGYQDGLLVNTDEVRYNVTYWIRKIQPDVVITWNPTYHTDLYIHGYEHSDHRASAEIVLQVAYPTARDPWFYPSQLDEGLSVWHVKQVWMISLNLDYNPTSHISIEITSTIDKKILAYQQHKSQYTSAEGLAAGVRSDASALGKVSGVTYAEDVYGEFLSEEEVDR